LIWLVWYDMIGYDLIWYDFDMISKIMAIIGYWWMDFFISIDKQHIQELCVYITQLMNISCVYIHPPILHCNNLVSHLRLEWPWDDKVKYKYNEIVRYDPYDVGIWGRGVHILPLSIKITTYKCGGWYIWPHALID
jgi:hypothetical protein